MPYLRSIGAGSVLAIVVNGIPTLLATPAVSIEAEPPENAVELPQPLVRFWSCRYTFATLFHTARA